MFTSAVKLIQQASNTLRRMEHIPGGAHALENTTIVQETRKRPIDANSSGIQLGDTAKRMLVSGADLTESFGSRFPNITTGGTRRFSSDLFLHNSINIEHVIQWARANRDKHNGNAPQFDSIIGSLNEIVSMYGLEHSVLKNAPTSPIKTEEVVNGEPTSPDVSIQYTGKCDKTPQIISTPINQKRQLSTVPTITSSPPKVVPKPSVTKKPASTKPVVIELSEEQQQVANLVLKGHNIFYTGSAGTGKSFLLKHIVKILNQKFGTGVAVTASTGLAAYNIGGMTINSYLGIGIGKGKPEEICKRIRNNKKIKERWQSLNVLIIDEVSMINGNLIDKLDWIARRLLDASKPFGGIQIVLCGDFYQLPPVDRKKDNFNEEEVIYAFESKFWQQHIKLQIILKKIFRQQNDKVFLDMLQEVRDGVVSDSTIKKFQSLARPLSIVDGVLPTRLFPTRRETDTINKQMLQNLPGESFKFKSLDSGSMIHSEQGRKMLENFLAPAEIELKVGAQVMLIKNMDDKLVNGTLGIVVGFMDNQTFSQVKGLNVDYFEGVPDDATYYDYDSENEDPPYGEFSTANRLFKRMANPLNSSIFDCLAKVKEEINRNMDGDPVRPIIVDSQADKTMDTSDVPYVPSEDNNGEVSQTVDVRNLRNSDKVEILKDIERKEELLKALYDNAGSTRYPLVAFKVGEKERRMVLIHPEEFVIEDEKRVPVVSRKQVPIMLSWALSIHKSQGQTLQKVTVDLQRVFETGQAYVALSRAVHRRGLQVVNFHKDKIRTNPKVKTFYDNLFTATDAVSMIDQGNLVTTSAGQQAPGQMTQLETLHANTASPERFANYQMRKKPTNVASQMSISDMLKGRRSKMDFLDVSDSEI